MVRPLDPSLPRAAYCDEAFFAREQRAIFWDQWFCVGRAEQFAQAGAYRVFDVAGESVIVIRAQSGKLHAHLNLCRHRGSRLLCDSGTVRGAIKCPYHGWAYALDGRLIASPFIDPEAIPQNAKHLYRVGLEIWGGFIFLHLSPESAERTGETLTAQLGAVPTRLAHYPLAELRIARTIQYDVAANWKVLLENYNECYHCAGVHPELCRVVPAFKQRGGGDLDWEQGIPHREGAFTFTFSGTTSRAAFSGLDRAERERHKGELIYPNFLLSLAAEHVAAFTIWPRDPLHTTVVCDFLFHPDEITKADFDPTDVTSFWDLVNRQDWAICENVQAGMRSHAFRYGYYSPMEDWSLDMRRYVAERLGADAISLDTDGT